MLDFKFVPIKLNVQRRDYILRMTGRVLELYYDSAPNTFYDKTLPNKLVLKYLANNTITTVDLPAPEINQWMHVHISQEVTPRTNVYLYKVEIDGDLVLSVENVQESYIEKVELYAGNPSSSSSYQPKYIKEIILMEKLVKVR